MALIPWLRSGTQGRWHDVRAFRTTALELRTRDRARATPHVVREEQSPVLAAVREAAADAGMWVAIGSLPAIRRVD